MTRRPRVRDRRRRPDRPAACLAGRADRAPDVTVTAGCRCSRQPGGTPAAFKTVQPTAQVLAGLCMSRSRRFRGAARRGRRPYGSTPYDRPREPLPRSGRSGTTRSSPPSPSSTDPRASALATRPAAADCRPDGWGACPATRGGLGGRTRTGGSGGGDPVEQLLVDQLRLAGGHVRISGQDGPQGTQPEDDVVDVALRPLPVVPAANRHRGIGCNKLQNDRQPCLLVESFGPPRSRE